MTGYQPLLLATAAHYALDAELLAAQVVVESSGRPDAFHYDDNFYRKYIVGNPAARAARFGPLAACSYGLLQLELETAYELGFMGLPHQLFDPAMNLEWGAKYLAQLLTREGGDYVRALEAYNAGPGNLPAGRLYAQRVLDQAQVRG